MSMASSLLKTVILFLIQQISIKDEQMIRTLLSARKEKPVICIINSCNTVQNL